MGTLDDRQSPQPYQRRIGERHPIQVELTWGPVPKGRWGRKPKPWTVSTIDVSLSGFGFESDTKPDILRGQPVMITLGEVTCGAMVRVAKRGSTPERTYYGVEFQDERMLETVKRLIANFDNLSQTTQTDDT